MSSETSEPRATETETRLVRLDVSLKATIQLEVPAGSSTETARDRCARALFAALERTKQDKSVSIERAGDEKYYDPTGPKG